MMAVLILAGAFYVGRLGAQMHQMRHQTTAAVSQEAKVRKVVVDAGHGGFDSGKVGINGALEKDINLEIAERLKTILEQQDIQVVMTREEDKGLYEETASNKKAQDLKKRCILINEGQADCAVSIHQNSYQSPEVKGAQVFYYKHSAEGKKLAQILQKSLKENLDTENKRQEKEDSTYYMLLHTGAPTVIAECGFLSNPQEAALLNTAEYRQKVAEALCKGILEYFTSTGK